MESRDKLTPIDLANISASATSEPDADTKRRIRAYQRQLRRLSSELCFAEARERREIASDLHDHIGQALAYVSQKVAILQGNTVFSGFESDFAEILSILKQTIKYTRDLTVEISPPVLYELGLSAALEWLAERTHNRHGVQIDQTQTGQVTDVSEEVSVFIFKAVQELITNSVKHARADHIYMHTTWGPDTISIEVSDNGVGFDTKSLEIGLTAANCFGLFSIRERLSYIGGQLSVHSAPGQGTKVSLVTGYSPTTEAGND